MLTVRLPPSIENALDNYCATHGVTKSHVVQECLSTFLVTHTQAEELPQQVSPAYAAFKRAGLIGSVRGNGESATRDVVRQRMGAKLKRNS